MDLSGSCQAWNTVSYFDGFKFQYSAATVSFLMDTKFSAVTGSWRRSQLIQKSTLLLRKVCSYDLRLFRWRNRNNGHACQHRIKSLNDAINCNFNICNVSFNAKLFSNQSSSNLLVPCSPVRQRCGQDCKLVPIDVLWTITNEQQIIHCIYGSDYRKSQTCDIGR